MLPQGKQLSRSNWGALGRDSPADGTLGHAVDFRPQPVLSHLAPRGAGWGHHKLTRGPRNGLFPSEMCSTSLGILADFLGSKLFSVQVLNFLSTDLPLWLPWSRAEWKGEGGDFISIIFFSRGSLLFYKVNPLGHDVLAELGPFVLNRAQCLCRH